MTASDSESSVFSKGHSCAQRKCGKSLPVSGFTSLGLHVCRLKSHIVDSLAMLHMQTTATLIPPTHHCTVRTIQLKGFTSNILCLKKSALCVSVCVVCMYVCISCVFAWCLQRPEEGAGFPGIRVIDCCEPPCVVGIEPSSEGRVTNALHLSHLPSPPGLTLLVVP